MQSLKDLLHTCAIVLSYDAGGQSDIPAEVIVSHLYDASYHLEVIREQRQEESILCKDYQELVDVLIVNVHGGRELAYGKHWEPVKEPMKPYLGQRAHVINVGFGTIVDIREDGWLRVEIDGSVAQWYAVDVVEPLATYHAC